MRHWMPLLFALCLLVPIQGQAQGQPRQQEVTLAAKIANLQKIDGYLPLYWDAANGKMLLEISRFNTEFLYQVSLPAGVGSNPIGLDRGQLGGTYVVSFERVGPKVLMMQPNYRYRALSNDEAERRAVADSFARSVLWGFKVEASEGQRVLVDATAFFLRDAHGVVERHRGDVELLVGARLAGVRRNPVARGLQLGAEVREAGGDAHAAEAEVVDRADVEQERARRRAADVGRPHAGRIAGPGRLVSRDRPGGQDQIEARQPDQRDRPQGPQGDRYPQHRGGRSRHLDHQGRHRADSSHCPIWLRRPAPILAGQHHRASRREVSGSRNGHAQHPRKQ